MRARRGHLLANLFGGSGRDLRNLVWLHEIVNNSPYKTQFENPVRTALERGESVRFSIEPHFRANEAAPYEVRVWAATDSGQTIVSPTTIPTPGLSDVPLPTP